MSSNLENIKPIVIAMAALDEQIKELTAKKKEYEAEVRAALADKGRLQFDEYIVSVKTQPGRKTLDKEALQEAFGDLTPFEKVGKPYSVMRIEKVDQV